jgi:hypothetical protein
LEVYDAEGVLEDAGLSRDDVLPIAAGPGEEVDRYRDVVEFIASVRDYTRTTQLVPTDIRRAVDHGGGVAIMKGRITPPVASRVPGLSCRA